MIFIDNVKKGMVAAQDIYPYEGAVTPLVRKDTVLTDAIIESMQRHDIRFLYIREKTDAPRSREDDDRRAAILRNYIPVPKPPPLVSPKLRGEALGGLEDIFTAISLNPDDIHTSTQVVKQLDTVVAQLVESLAGDRGTLVNIADLKSYDEYTYHHSLSVAVLTIAIAQRLGFGRGELHRLGMCAMMHDIGKTAIPIELINKPSRLDDAEYEKVKEHSPAGYDCLVKTAIGDEEIRRAVLAHHEKLDGTGYPNGLKGEEIPVWSRIISVADVYDALTSKRPYRTPMQPAEALEYIMGGVGTAFDYDMVAAFIKKVELYPVAGFVELSSGKVAVVLSNENQMRPVVRVIDTGEVLDLYHDRRCLNIVVSRLLPEPPAILKGL